MKKLFLKSVVVMLLANGGCGWTTETQDSESNVRVQIPHYQAGQAELKTVTLYGIEDLSTVSGRHAIFYYAPKIEGSHIIGVRARAKFIKNPDGVFIPTDSQSAEMASIYYHLQNLSLMDRQLGFEGLNAGPRRVALSTRILNSNEWLQDSAFYDFKSDAFIFVDFSSSALPLTINPGVIAHEYFHSIFSKLVLGPLLAKGLTKESPLGDENAPSYEVLEKHLMDYVFLKGLNEGLADFWGWVYVQDEDFVAKSLPAHHHRSLRPALKNTLVKPEYVSERIKELSRREKTFSSESVRRLQMDIAQDAYVIGTMYAKFFRRLMKDELGQDLTGTRRTEFLHKLVLFLVQIQKDTKTSEDIQKNFYPMGFIEKFKTAHPALEKTHCRIFAEALSKECQP